MICIVCKKPPSECRCKGFKKWAGKDRAMTDAKKPEADGIRAAAEEIFRMKVNDFVINNIESIIRRAVERVEKNTYCAACNCSACTDARHRIRQGG